MGNVICVYKIVPDAIETFNEVKSAVESMNPSKIEEEPLAFGMNLVKATFLVPEVDGALEELENKLNSIEHASSVELENMTRVL